MFEKILSTTLSETIMITFFVLFMMVLIEYINIQSKNIWSEKLSKSPFMQIMVAALLGITPGCLGAFTVVSLYTHRMMGLAALVTVMIATSGDEAFVMFALFPRKCCYCMQFYFLLPLLPEGSSISSEERKPFLIHTGTSYTCTTIASVSTKP